MRQLDQKFSAVMTRPMALFVLRAGLALMFIESAIDKALHFPFYISEADAVGVPLPALAVAAALVVEAIGSVALLTGLAARPALLMLAAYTVSVNFFYFDFWNLAGRDAAIALKAFLKNIAVAAGILLALAGQLRNCSVGYLD